MKEIKAMEGRNERIYMKGKGKERKDGRKKDVILTL
jgi:hypothetical protein